MALSSLKHHQHYHHHSGMPFSVSDLLLSNNLNQTFNNLDDEFHNNVKKFSNAYSNGLAEANPAMVKMEKLQAQAAQDLNSNSYSSNQNAINQRAQLTNSVNSTQSQYSNIMGSCTPSPSINTPPDSLGYAGASFNNDQAAVAAAAAYLNSYNNPNSAGYASSAQQMGYHHPHHPHHHHQINRLSPPQFQNIQGSDPASFYNSTAAAAAAAAYQNNSSWFNGQSDRLSSRIIIFIIKNFSFRVV